MKTKFILKKIFTISSSIALVLCTTTNYTISAQATSNDSVLSYVGEDVLSIELNVLDSNYTLLYVISDGEVTITGCSGIPTNVHIPSEIEGLPVTKIAEKAFYGNSTALNFVLPDTLVEIGDKAFSNCSALDNINIPDSTTTIGTAAFQNCNDLQSVDVGKSVSTIKELAFSVCKNLYSINVDTENPYFSTDNKILYNKDKTKLIQYAGNTYSVYITNSTVEIGDYAFFGLSKVRDIFIPPSVTTIGKYAFAGCFNIQEMVLLDNVKQLGEGCFMNCTSLEKITLGNGITTIPKECFSFCSNMIDIVIPDSVTSISDEAFYECINLKYAHIPESVTKIGEHAIGFSYDIRSNEFSPISDFYILSHTGSTIENYALENKLGYIDYKNILIGDLNNDNAIDSVDSTYVLNSYANIAIGKKTDFNIYEQYAGDFNNDGIIDSIDASSVLSHYANSST